MNAEHIPTIYEIDRAIPDHCAEPVESQIYLWRYFNYHPRYLYRELNSTIIEQLQAWLARRKAIQGPLTFENNKTAIPIYLLATLKHREVDMGAKMECQEAGRKVNAAVCVVLGLLVDGFDAEGEFGELVVVGEGKEGGR